MDRPGTSYLITDYAMIHKIIYVSRSLEFKKMSNNIGLRIFTQIHVHGFSSSFNSLFISPQMFSVVLTIDYSLCLLLNISSLATHLQYYRYSIVSENDKGQYFSLSVRPTQVRETHIFSVSLPWRTN